MPKMPRAKPGAHILGDDSALRAIRDLTGEVIDRYAGGVEARRQGIGEDIRDAAHALRARAAQQLVEKMLDAGIGEARGLIEVDLKLIDRLAMIEIVANNAATSKKKRRKT